jgi:hypothetical protein
MNDCLIAVGVDDVLECAASFITWVRLTSPIGSAAGGSVNLSTSLSNVAKLAAHSKFVWVFNASCDGTIIYNDPVLPPIIKRHQSQISHLFYFIKNDSAISYIGNLRLYLLNFNFFWQLKKGFMANILYDGPPCIGTISRFTSHFEHLAHEWQWQIYVLLNLFHGY